MAGRNLSRVLLKALPTALKVILRRIAVESLATMPDLDGLVAYPALKGLPRDPNGPADPDDWQLTSSHHGEHLRPPEPKQLSSFSGFKQQWFQSQSSLLHSVGLGPGSSPLLRRRCRIAFG